MLSMHLSFNFSVIIAFMYFLAYTLTFIVFFIIVNFFSKYSTNLHQIMCVIKYSRTQSLFFVITLLVFLGIPPFYMFTSKFAGLVLSWFFSGFIFFTITLFIVFLSFALYLQLFDLLFKVKSSIVENYSFSSEILKSKPYSLHSFNNYEQHTILTGLSIFNVFGFLLFKDFFFCLAVFI